MLKYTKSKPRRKLGRIVSSPSGFTKPPPRPKWPSGHMEHIGTNFDHVLLSILVLLRFVKTRWMSGSSVSLEEEESQQQNFRSADNSARIVRGLLKRRLGWPFCFYPCVRGIKICYSNFFNDITHNANISSTTRFRSWNDFRENFRTRIASLLRDRERIYS